VSHGDGVSVSIDVGVEPDLVFAVFTEEIDAWWGRGPRFRFVAPYQGTMVLEPAVGGRLLHVPAAAGPAFVVGLVEVWEPPRRLAFTWRLPNFAPDQVTYVDVRFDPRAEGTRVTVTHRGWDGVPAGHPARHGLEDREFILMKGQWWGALLGALRRRAEARRAPAPVEGGHR
jgi:uncharacterized protein YndB with AHSA1/START domain